MYKRHAMPLALAAAVMLLMTSGCSLGAATPPATTATATGTSTRNPLGFVPDKQAPPVPQVALSGPLPDQVDLSNYNPPVGEQSANTCTSWALGYYMRGWYSKRDGYYPAGSSFAPMYLYAQIAQGTDTGSSFKDNLEILSQQGIDARNDYVQGDSDFTSQPTDAERTNAARYKIANYEYYENQGSSGGRAAFKTWIQLKLSGGTPVAIAFPVYDEFKNAKSSSSFVTVPKDTNSLQGYHASFAYGYDARGLLIENSWGPQWGEGGYAELSWDFVTNYGVEVASYTPTKGPVLEQLPGTATDISVGADGSVWAIGTTPAPGGFDILHWNASSWTWKQDAGVASRGAVRIAVGPDGDPWIVNSSGEIFHWTGSWQQYPGAARDIAVASDGTPWVVGKSSVLVNKLAARVATGQAHLATPPPGLGPNPDDGGVFRWIYNGWQQIAGGANRISISGIYPWEVGSSGAIIQRWGIDLLQRQLSGSADDIGCGSDTLSRTCWVIGTSATQVNVFAWSGSGWDRANVVAPGRGGAGAISVGPSNNAWFVDHAGRIFELPEWGDF